MKYSIFFLVAFAVLTLSFSHTTEASNHLSQEEQEELMEKYEALKKRLEYLRWYVKKFDLQKEINAKSYLVLNNSNPSSLLEKDNSSAYPIASITKLMTAVVALENIGSEEKITLRPEMFLINSWQRPSPAIYSGATLFTGDLIKACLIQSTNNAAHSLASYLTEERFVRLMNEKAKEIGMKNTFFHDAHGLSSLNRSSSGDIAKLLNYIAEEHPELLEITKIENFQLPGNCPDHNWVCTFKNLNTFHGIESFIGGKTGYTTASGNTFAGMFSFQDSPYSIVLFNTTSRTSDVQKIAKWLESKPQ